jgi:chromate transporter
LTLFKVYLVIGLLSFGGGLTAWMHRETVVKRGWIGDDDFMNGLALSQVLPGTNVSNLAVYIGQRLRGAGGAAAALFGLLLGPFLGVIALTTVYETYTGLAWLHRALDGAAAAAIGLMLVMAARGARRSATTWSSGLSMLAIAVAIGVLQWPMLWVVLVVAPISVAFAFARMPR